MMYASSNPAAGGFSRAQARRVVQHMALAAIWNAAVTAPAKVFAALAERHRVARTIDALNALSDHTLADIGISRDQIGHVARHYRDTRF